MKTRKILSALLALAMVMALAVPAFAADYAPYDLTTLTREKWGTKVQVTFDAATATEETLTVNDMEGTYDAVCQIVHVQPGSNMNVVVTSEDEDDVDPYFAPYYFTREGNTVSAVEALYVDADFASGNVSDWYTAAKKSIEDGSKNKGTVYAQFDEIWTYSEDDEDDAHLETIIFIVVDEGQAAVQPEQPAEPTTPIEPEQPAQPETPAAPAAGTYTVKQWDTWGQLALNNYGTYAVWPALMKANGSKPLSVGMTVTLPEKLGSYARLAPQVLAEGEKFYTVKAGDTLGQIAVSEYGNFMMYKDIFQRNSDRLKNVNSIYEGQILVLPAKK